VLGNEKKSQQLNGKGSNAGAKRKKLFMANGGLRRVFGGDVGPDQELTGREGGGRDPGSSRRLSEQGGGGG